MSKKKKDTLNHIVVTDKEIVKYDAMIRKIINQNILKYWANGVNIDSKNFNISIGRFGQGLDDLMQFGRLEVLQQLRWYKQNGRNGEGTASEATMMYNHLRNKFQSLSKTHTNKKHGGLIISVAEHKQILETFLADIKKDATVAECVSDLKCLLDGANKEVVKVVNNGLLNDDGELHPSMTTVKDISEHIYKKMNELTVVSHTSFEHLYSNYNAPVLPTPEDYYFAKEAVKERLKSKKGVKFYVPGGYAFRIFNLAKGKGVKTKGDLAKLVGVSNTTLSNVLYGFTKGNARVREKFFKAFGEPVERLVEIEPAVE